MGFNEKSYQMDDNTNNWKMNTINWEIMNFRRNIAKIMTIKENLSEVSPKK
jgi:ribosomal protein L29